jgi:heptosyltransferase-2
MKLLVVAPAWVGDMVMAHCLIQRLRADHPHTEIQVLAPPATAPLALRMREVSTTHTLDVAHGEFGLAARWRCGRVLARQGFDRAFVLPNSWKSALVPWFARVSRRTGWLGEARFGLLNDWARLPEAGLDLMIERFMALANLQQLMLARPYPQPRLKVDGQQQSRLLAKFGLGIDLQAAGRAVALCPGAEFGPAKQWPIEHYAAVARHCAGAGRPVWLLGAPNDLAACAELVELAGGAPVNLAGQTDLCEALDLIAAAGAVVCNDSGLMHVACAVATPVVAVFGSTSPAFTPPLHESAQVLSLLDSSEAAVESAPHRLDCQPCFERTCRFGHAHCLAWLTPDRVIEALERLDLPDS